MARYYLQENGVDRYLLEDGSGLYLQEEQFGPPGGQQSTVGQGLVAKVLSVALVGLALTAGQGTVSAQGSSVSAALVGSESTTATGNLIQSADRALLGRSITASQGLLYATGRSALQSAQGTAVANITLPLIGQVSVTGTGLIFPNSSGTVPLVGSSITSESGNVIAPGTRALTGSELTASLGTLGLTLRPTDPIGQVVTSASGTLSILANNVTVNITGYEITSQQGFVDAMPVLDGQVVPSASGTASPVLQVPLVGSVSMIGQGTLQIDQGASEDTFVQSAQGAPGLSSTVPLVGSASATATGTLSISADVFQALTGAAITSASDLMVPTPLLALVGEALQSAQENMGVPGSAALTGQEITSQAGTLFTTGDREQVLTGASMTAAAGLLSASPRLSISGVVLQSGSGQLGRSGGNMQFALTGQSSTGNTGTLGVIGQAVTPPGVSNEGCSIVSGVAAEQTSAASASGAEGCFIQSGTAKEVA